MVITGGTKCCVPAVSFFKLLQNLAIFVKISQKRMAVWIEVVGKTTRTGNDETIKANGLRPDGQENLMQQQLYLDVLMIPLPVLL